MSDKTMHLLSSYAQLKKLRTVLAIAQGMKLLSLLQKEVEETVSHDQAKRVTYMTVLFSRIHGEMFHDWKEQPTVNRRPGVMNDAAKRLAFREAIECLVLNDDNNYDSAIFDNNGFVMRTENIAERLARFYQQMRCIRPFAYGNRLTLDLFMSALSNLPAFKSVYEQGIDFRRLESTDSIALHQTQSPHDAVSLAFQHALDPTRTQSLNNVTNDYGLWPENKKFI